MTVLVDFVKGLDANMDIEASVGEMINEAREWDLNKFKDLISSSVLLKIKNIHSPVIDLKDGIVWGPDSSGEFFVSSYYKATMKDKLGVKKEIWGLIWKWNGMERVKFFPRLAAHGRLCTNERRAMWGNSSLMCPLCSNQIESMLHILRDCR